MGDEKKDADLSCRIPGDLKERLAALKAAYERSEGWLVIKCLEAHLPALEAEVNALREPPAASEPLPPAPRPKSSHYPRHRRKTNTT